MTGLLPLTKAVLPRYLSLLYGGSFADRDNFIERYFPYESVNLREFWLAENYVDVAIRVIKMPC